MKYSVNSIIETKGDNGKPILERILWLDEQWTYLIDINKNNVPYIKRIEDLEVSLADKTTVLKEEDPLAIVYKEEDIPQKYKEIRDKYWTMIKEIVIEEPHIFQNTFRRKHVKEIAKQYNVSQLSIMNSLKRYWKRGKVPNALLPDYLNCGGRGKERVIGTTKRGRPRKHQDIVGEGVNITEEIKKIFTIAINRFYYTTAKNSLVLTYELMRKEYFIDGYKMINGVEVPIIKSQSEIPTFGQFRYWFEKQRNIKKEITSRYSNKRFQKQHRAITGNAGDGVMQPGVYEIDSTIADVHLVSRYNRNWVCGRPTLYFVVDKFSYMICGIYVGYETGSYAGSMMALLNAYMNKVEFCKQYGIHIKEEDWPVHNVIPEKVICDRGELENTGISSLINTLNIQVTLAPPYRADLKSFVERAFKQFGDYYKPHIPGTIDLDGRERGDKDYRTSATVDIFQFTQIVIKAVLYHNNYHILNNFKRDEMMIADNIPCVPRDIFNWGIANRGGTLRTVSEDVVKLALMPSDEATVTAKGVKYKDMYYVSKEMLKNQTFVNARKKTWKVKISYDPRDLNYIYVHGDSPKDYEVCYLTDANSRYKDKTIEEIEYLLTAEKMQKKKMKDIDAQAKTQLIAEIEDIVQQAKEELDKEPVSEESDKKRIENIRENRKIEKTANRVKEAFKLEVEEKPVEDSDFHEEEVDPIELLLIKQKEGLQSD